MYRLNQLTSNQFMYTLSLPPKDSYFDPILGRNKIDSIFCNDSFIFDSFRFSPTVVTLYRFNLSVSSIFPSCYTWIAEINLKRNFGKKESKRLMALKVTMGKEDGEDIIDICKLYDIREDRDLLEKGYLLEDERIAINMIWNNGRKGEKELDNRELSDILYKQICKKNT